MANVRICLSAKEIKFLFYYSNIAHRSVPLALIGGTSNNPSEGRGQRFESSRVRQSHPPRNLPPRVFASLFEAQDDTAGRTARRHRVFPPQRASMSIVVAISSCVVSGLIVHSRSTLLSFSMVEDTQA